MEKLLETLKNNDYRLFQVMGSEQLEIIADTDLDSAQEGYRFNPIKNEVIEDWGTIVGDEYYVVGFNSMLGDPILVDTSKENLPVYNMFSDKWESRFPVATSFDELISNLKKLDEMINIKKEPRETIKKFAVDLDDKIHSAGFYEALCFDILDEEGLHYEDYQPK